MKPFGLPSLFQLRGLLELVCLVVFAGAAAAQGAPQGRSVKILTDVPTPSHPQLFRRCRRPSLHRSTPA